MWEATLSDDKICKEVAGDKFQLDWETPGAVKLFKVVDGDSNFSVNLETGEFFNGEKKIKGGLTGSLGDFGLRFFKRNVVVANSKGETISHKITPFIGYVKGTKEKLLKIQEDRQVFSNR